MDELSKQFSVVIQGPVFGKPGEAYEIQKTQQCIESVRKVLPGAEIILSTWEGSDVSHLKVDKIIFNKDPGAITFNDVNKNYFNNSNRQIVSTYGGLKIASRKYAIKLRGDCLLQHAGFTEFFNRYQEISAYPFFKHRVIIPTIYSRNPRRIPILFHPSDIFQVGLTEDLVDLWNIPLQPEPATTRAVSPDQPLINDPYPKVGYRMKFAAEQYVWFAFARKRGLDLNINHYCNLPPFKLFKSELSIINNFIIASPEQLGVLLPTRFQNEPNLYTHEEWLELYNNYCLKGYKIADKIKFIAEVYTNNISIIANRFSRSFKRRIKSVLVSKKAFQVGN